MKDTRECRPCDEGGLPLKCSSCGTIITEKNVITKHCGDCEICNYCGTEKCPNCKNHWHCGGCI